MSWNPAGTPPAFGGQFHGNGFPAQAPGTFGMPNGQFGVPTQGGTGDVFGFTPDAMSAFGTGTLNWATPGGSAFGTPVAQVNFGAPMLDMSAFGGAIDATAFQTPVFNQPPSSLFDMAHTSNPPASASIAVATPQKDPFGDLSIADIKSGYVAPRNLAPLPSPVPSATTTTEKRHINPETTKPTPLAPTPIAAPAAVADSSFEWSSSASTPSVEMDWPETASTPQPSTSSVPVSHSATSTKAPEPKAPTIHTANELLASIDLSTPSKPLKEDKPAHSALNTPYSNASLVKSTIDWSQKRDLMASFLASPAQPAPATEQLPQAHETVTPSSPADDWSSFEEGSKHDASADWSSFDQTSSPTAFEPHPQSTQSMLVSPSREGVATPEPERPVEVSLPTSTPSPAPSADWEAFMAQATKGASSGSADAFGFDPSTFDTSAFNFGESSTPVPTPASLPTSIDASSTPSITVVQNSAIPLEKSPSVHEKPETSSGDQFADFGDFSSSGHDADWSAFPEDTPTTKPGEDSLATPIDSLPVPEPKSSSSLTASPRSSRTKILDLNSFTLPTMGGTPVKHKEESLLAEAPVQEGKPLLDFSGFEATPVATTKSADLFSLSGPAFTPTSTTTSLGMDFGLASDPSEIPSWMNSNKSDDSASMTPHIPVMEPPKSSDAPTMESLRRQLVELLGNDKAAPYTWIFDNMTRQITLSFEERQALALGLMEDIKSGKSIWVSSSRVNQWHNVLTKCNEDLTKACNYLSTVSMQADMHSDEVLISFFQNEKTRSYLESLAKIYRVASRISVSVRSSVNPLASNGGKSNQTPKTTCKYLKPSVIKSLSVLGSTIESTWQSLLSQVSEMEAPVDTGNGNTTALPSALLMLPPIVPHAPLNHVCFMCYRGFDEHEGPSTWQAQNYHASCANYWINRVSPKPPSV